MKKTIKNKYIKSLLFSLLGIISFVLLLEIIFLFFSKPILYKTIQNKVSSATDSVYNLSFDKLKINLFTGEFTITNFQFNADTLQYFSKEHDVINNLYNIELDTFKIERIYVSDFFKKDKTLKIRELHISNPKLKVFGLKQKDTTILVEQKSADYETVRKDIISSAFSFVNAVSIEKIIITNGNFDFLKPRADNPNPFSIKSITFILNDFYANSKTFSTNKKDIFSEDITLIINEYKLKLNDNIHELTAKKVYISTREKTIALTDISLNSGDKNTNYLLQLNSNIFDFKIKNITLNADFKEIFLKKQVTISKATITDFDALIFNQKIKEKKKFNKDSILDKLEIYPLFSNYLHFIQIDTLNIKNGSIKTFKKFNSRFAKTEITNYNVDVTDFLIDSTSIYDTTRVFYAKEFLLHINGFKQRLNDSIHILTAEYVVGSTKTKILWASDIQIKPKEDMLLWAKNHKKSQNNTSIERIDIKGINFQKYFNYNQIEIDKLSINNSNISINNFSKNKKKNKTLKKPLNELFLNFAEKMTIHIISIKNGNLNYRATNGNKNLHITGKYRINISNFTFDPYNTKITKQTKVSSINAFVSNVKLNTADSIYTITLDTLHYSTYDSLIILKNLLVQPTTNDLFKKLHKRNTAVTLNLSIPTLKVSNTNLSNAFQSDSLSLNDIQLIKPAIEITSYPSIKLKTAKNETVDSIKKAEIEQFKHYIYSAKIASNNSNPVIDSTNLHSYNQKNTAIDSIVNFAENTIDKINISLKDVRNTDTSIAIISHIAEIATFSCLQIIKDSLSFFDINNILNSTISDITTSAENYETPNFSVDILYNVLGEFLPKISSNSLVITDGLLRFRKNSNENTKNVLQTNFTLRLYKFNFDTAYIKDNENILYAQNFDLTFNRLIYYLPDNFHQINIKEILFNSRNSSIFINKLRLSTKYIDTTKMCTRMNISNIRFNSIYFNDLYFHKNLIINNLIINKPKIYIYLPRTIKQGKHSQKKQFLIPKILNEIQINIISLKNGKFNIYKNWPKPFIKGNFDIDLAGFYADSVIKFDSNKYFLPIKDVNISVQNLNFTTPDSIQKISFDTLNFKPASQSLTISGLSITNLLKDSIAFKQFIKTKTAANIKIPHISIIGLDFEKFRYNKILIFNQITANKPIINISKTKKDTSKTKQIPKIDLYGKIAKFTNSISGNSIYINNAIIKSNTYTDTSKKSFILNDFSLFINNLKIDSSTSYTSPNLFYAQNISFIANNYSTKIQHGFYTINIGQISGSTQNKNITLSNINYKPIVPLNELQSIIDTFRQVAISAKINTLSIKNINFLKYINEQNIEIGAISSDSAVITAFTDKSIPHNNTKEQNHLLEHIFNLQYIFTVNSINLNNYLVIYNEIDSNKNQVAELSLNLKDININAITNDMTIINNLDVAETKISTTGMINDSAKFSFDVSYNLKNKAKTSKVSGTLGRCNASLFNTYLINSTSYKIQKGKIDSIDFAFVVNDTYSYGEIIFEYSNLKVVSLSKDTTKRILKFKSWVVNVAISALEDSHRGVTHKEAFIGDYYDKSYSDFKLWIDAIISGAKTIVYIPNDAKQIKKDRKKKKDN